METVPDQVFVIRGPGGVEEWRAILWGRTLPHTWNSKGAAEAGLATERRRALVKALSAIAGYGPPNPNAKLV